MQFMVQDGEFSTRPPRMILLSGDALFAQPRKLLEMQELKKAKRINKLK
jgi:hypothetical protein